jgi:neutral ceramidase
MSEYLLKAGAGRAEIRIPESFFPYQGIRGRLYTGQHDAIHVRSLMIDNGQTKAMILSIELGDFGEIERWQKLVGDLSGVPADNVLITVTHNHMAPHASDSYNQSVVDADKTPVFNSVLETAVIEAVRQAKAQLRPARMGYGTGSCAINVNRDELVDGRYTLGRNPHGPTDQTVAVLKFEDTLGMPIGFFVNYAVHGIVMFDTAVKDGGMLVGGDLPGETSRQIEKRFNDQVVALWTSGAAADLGPMFMARWPVFGPNAEQHRADAGASGYLLVDVLADWLSEEVLAVASRMDRMSADVTIKSAQKLYVVPGKKKAQKPFDVPQDYVYEDGESVNLLLSVLLVGTVALVGIPGEAVCSIGLRLKESLPFRNVIAITHCNGSISYVSDDLGFERKTFAALVSHVQRDFGEKAILNGSAEMIQSLINAV